VLTDPVLLGATPTSVRVVWFTEQQGRGEVALADGRRFPARTTLLSRTAEDAASTVPGRRWERLTPRPVWRHEATVDGLAPVDGRTPGRRVGYHVSTVDDTGRRARSEEFTLAPDGVGDLLLLTSDHQLRALTAVNLQAAYDLAGDRLAGVLCAGDLVNMPDRASEWFDHGGGCGFFPALQGRASVTVGGHSWRGAPIVQHVPLYPAPGNHEVTGEVGEELDERFVRVQPGGGDTTTYQEIFGVPRWYATTIGPVRLIVLFATRVWRPSSWDGSVCGTFAEATADLADPARWGHGQHIFASLARGSEQYEWLAAELAGEPSRSARFRVVMLHHPVHGIGWTAAPPFTDPVPAVERDAEGAVTAVRYEYPLAGDQLLHDVEPLLSRHRVHLVLSGHAHVWNRFRNRAGVHFLETSNVGNTFGAFLPGGEAREMPGPGDGFRETYAAVGDAGGLAPIVPTVDPAYGPDGAPLPYHARNDVTAFSLLDTTAGVVRSYRFDPADPAAGSRLFDEFPLI
jgi:hypothetical protein